MFKQHLRRLSLVQPGGPGFAPALLRIFELFFTSRKGIAISLMLVILTLTLAVSPGVHAQAPTTWTVESNADSGKGCNGTACDTLRDAMNVAKSGDTIIFNISNATVNIATTLPNVTIPLTIDGTKQNVTIRGNNSVRIFAVGSGGNLTLDSLTVTLGNSGLGGGLYNNGGTVMINSSIFSANGAS